MIKIIDDERFIAEDGWDYPIEELDYLLESVANGDRDSGALFVLKDGRLYEGDSEALLEAQFKWIRRWSK